ncbi:MAG: EAL domain-containing protein [Gammaproteobacteria bacterium]|nr:EAL domain-containing protein [Gammaproteobacteria bacterium]
MSQDTNLRLIIVDDSLDDAERCVSNLRPLGYAIRSTRVENADDFIDALDTGDCDLILCSLDSTALPLTDIVTHLSDIDPPPPVIALADEGDDITPDSVMSVGACHLVNKTTPNHLKLVVARELENVRRTRLLSALQTSYLDSEKRCQVLMESSRDAIAYVHDGMHVYANLAYLDLFGYESFDEIEGTPIMDMAASADQARLKEFLRKQIQGNSGNQKLEIKLHHSDESTFSGEMEFSRATIDGESCMQIVIRDQTNSKELERQITLLSQTDQLTGLFNRQHLITTLQQQFADKSKAKPATLSLLELDNFDALRDEVGVLGADQVIKGVGKLLGEASPQEAVAARFEGATFAILSPHLSDEETQNFSLSMVKAVSKFSAKVGGTDVRTACHIGVCTLGKDVGDANEALSRAERALAASRAGKESVATFAPKAGEKSQKQIDTEWTKRFERALKKNEMRIQFQPIVSLGGDETERFEVLVRMDVDGKEMTESEFLPIAERTSMLNSVDRWVILNTLKKLVVKLKENENTVFFVRLSRGALEDGELFRWIHDRVKALKLPHGSLVFQFDEQDALSHLKQARAFSFALHKINCKISLDNFGTGPNPFQLLKHVPADFLKINQAFMDGLLSNQKNQEAIQKIAAKAKELGKPTIAPSVEDAGSLSVLWSLGTDLIQGNFLQKPTDDPSYDFSAMMA